MTIETNNLKEQQSPDMKAIQCYAPLSHGSLFSGIGGFDLAAEWVGWDNRFHCEWNEFGKKILKHYWPNAESYGDITKTDFTIWRGRIDVLTGGFPCQPYSLAGKRKGKEDERHLWPEMLRAICEIAPRYIVGENVPGLVNWNGGLVFDEVQADLEAAGYEIQPVILPACAVNAPHKRERVWFVAYRTGELQQRNEAGECGNKGQQNVQQEYRQADTKQPRTVGENGLFTNAYDNGQYGTKNGQSHFKGNDSNTARSNTVEQFTGCGGEATGTTYANADNAGLQRREKHGGITSGRANRNEQPTRFFRPTWDKFPTQPPVCGGNDGIPTQLDGITFSKWRNESIKAFGNAIVPQIAYQIFRAIQLHDASLSGA